METSFKYIDPLKAELFVTVRIAPPWGISSRMRDSGINPVVFHSSWLLIFSHKRNQVPRGAQAQKAIFRVCVEEKSFCGRKGKVLQAQLLFTDTLRMTLGNLIPPVAIIYVHWMIWKRQVNELYVCS